MHILIIGKNKDEILTPSAKNITCLCVSGSDDNSWSDFQTSKTTRKTYDLLIICKIEPFFAQDMIDPRALNSVLKRLKDGCAIEIIDDNTALRAELVKILKSRAYFHSGSKKNNVSGSVRTFDVFKSSSLKSRIASSEVAGATALANSPDVRVKKSYTTKSLLHKLDDPVFLSGITKNIQQFLAYKISFYEKTKEEVEEEYQCTKTKIDRLKALGYDLSSQSAIRDMFPTFPATACHLVDLEDIISTIQTKKACALAPYVKKAIIEAVQNPESGMVSLVGHTAIKEKLVKLIFNLSRNWRSFTKTFNNFCIMGESGMGKTALAKVISFVFSKIGLLSTSHIHIVSRSDIIASYIGQTAAKTKSLLISSLEGVLFIDEAYSLVQGGSQDYGAEAITELVNFLDKYVAMNVVILAGYEHIMKSKFFPSNDGLSRRFPHKINLERYSANELTEILVNVAEHTTDEFFEPGHIKIIKEHIESLLVKHKNPFQYHASDMVTIGNYLCEERFSGDSITDSINASFQRFGTERYKK